MLRILRYEEYKRPKIITEDISRKVTEILSGIKTRGDDALNEYERQYNPRYNGSIRYIELNSRKSFQEACRECSKKIQPPISADSLNKNASVSGEGKKREQTSRAQKARASTKKNTAPMTQAGSNFKKALEEAARNIIEYHRRQVPKDYRYSPKNGVILGQRVRAIEKVGVYVPGGRAFYPSSVLMNVIPAKLAGCKEIYIATPSLNEEVYEAGLIAGATGIYEMGGAQAIGAFAYGTERVKKVYKITGPGNEYVTEAKRQVYGECDIDMTAGASEVVIIGEDGSNAEYIASDMVSQAEHDVRASAVLLTASAQLANEVREEILRLLSFSGTAGTASAALEANGALILCSGRDEIIRAANEIAPEHLEVCVNDPFSWLDRIVNAGSVFLGGFSPVALGDYYAGLNHVLPTMGSAKFASPLSVADFVKTTQYVYYDRENLLKAADDIECLAMAEGLTAHAESIRIRRE